MRWTDPGIEYEGDPRQINRLLQELGFEGAESVSTLGHVDGTARVQVVKKDCTSIFRKIIEEYYERTGVPMLLNTSLNIRGMPMVDKHKDAKQFSDLYNVPVFT